MNFRARTVFCLVAVSCLFAFHVHLKTQKIFRNATWDAHDETGQFWSEFAFQYRFAKFFFRASRTTSLQAAKLFATDELDVVFIDANHQEVHVSTDITAWWPLLKAGGVLMGHDYGSPSWPGVTAAVNAYFGHPDEVCGTVWLKRKGAN